MSNERTTEGPLTATLGEQLGLKAQRGDPRAREAVEGDALRSRLAFEGGEEAGSAARGRAAPLRRGGRSGWIRWAAAAAGWMLVRGTVRRLLRR